MSDQQLEEKCVLCDEYLFVSSCECFDYATYCPNCGELNDFYWGQVALELADRGIKLVIEVRDDSND